MYSPIGQRKHGPEKGRGGSPQWKALCRWATSATGGKQCTYSSQQINIDLNGGNVWAHEGGAYALMRPNIAGFARF